MATTTTHFGWPVPQSTDLVKDGATAIYSLGAGVDTSLLDLKGGTTGQLLAKTTGTDMDFTWVANESQVLLSTTTLSGASTTISGIPATYKDLKIVIYGVNPSVAGNLRIAPNGSTGITDLAYVPTGSGPTSFLSGTAGYVMLQELVGGSATGNSVVVTITDYASTANGKPVAAVGGGVNSGSIGRAYFGFGQIVTNSAISSIVLSNSGGGTFSAGTVKVFGVK